MWLMRLADSRYDTVDGKYQLMYEYTVIPVGCIAIVIVITHNTRQWPIGRLSQVQGVT